jgi:hypothetical protein
MHALAAAGMYFFIISIYLLKYIINIIVTKYIPSAHFKFQKKNQIAHTTIGHTKNSKLVIYGIPEYLVLASRVLNGH